MIEVLWPAEDLPRCGECEMPVERLLVDVEGHNNIMIVECHGEVEAVVISSAMWDAIARTKLRFEWGPAFTGGHPKQLTGPDVGHN
jgi:hypothetical protein